MSILKIEMSGASALTMIQAKALLKAAKTILMRDSFQSQQSGCTLTAKEYRSCQSAVKKLERVMRLTEEG